MIIQLRLKLPAQFGGLSVINHVRLCATGYVRQAIDEAHERIPPFKNDDPGTRNCQSLFIAFFDVQVFPPGSEDVGHDSTFVEIGFRVSTSQ